jgi:glycosyltransferase involved in cell wall biosynthesis
MKTINLAHDSFMQYGGAERVFEGAREVFPESSIYTLVKDRKLDSVVENWNIITSPLQKIYQLYPHFTHLFALVPMVLFFWRPNTKPVLLSFSSSYIKGLKKNPDSVHINYCHTPTRFLWVDPEHALKEIPKILHLPARLYFWWLKKWDLRAARSVDHFIANSKEVQKRIKNIYNRDSKIIYPFVDVDFWKPTADKQDYFLIAGRLQYAKGLDVVISVFNELGLPLHVVGTGRYENKLRQMAKSNVKFLGKITDAELRNQYSGARAYVYPQFEDFGIMPLEAAACGTATIGLAKGGSLETIISGKTGMLLEEINQQTLTEAVNNWQADQFLQDDLIKHAQKFSKQEFQDQLRNYLEPFLNKEQN